MIQWDFDTFMTIKEELGGRQNGLIDVWLEIRAGIGTEEWNALLTANGWPS